MLNLRKLENIACIAFSNALRLHWDAIALFKDGRYPSAFYLSILAQEEIGKMHIINDFVWRARDTGQAEEFEADWLDLLYKHPHKQYAFLRNSPLNNQWSKRGLALSQEVFDGVLEAKKQGAVYVGLMRRGRKVDIKGKIKHPFQIKRKTTQDQITKINDYLLITGIGVKFGQYSLDNETVEHEMKSKRFIRSNFENWEHRGTNVERRIRVIQKFFGKKVVPL